MNGDANGAPLLGPGTAAFRPALPKNLSARRPSSCSGGRGPSRAPDKGGSCKVGSDGSGSKSVLGSSGDVGSSFKRWMRRGSMVAMASYPQRWTPSNERYNRVVIASNRVDGEAHVSEGIRDFD